MQATTSFSRSEPSSPAYDELIYNVLTGDLARLNSHIVVVAIGDGCSGGIGVAKIVEQAAKRQPAPFCGRLGRMHSRRGMYQQACGEAVEAMVRECNDIPAIAAINTIIKRLAPKPDVALGSDGTKSAANTSNSPIRLVEPGLKGDNMILNVYGWLLAHRHNEGSQGKYYHSTALREERRGLRRVLLCFTLTEGTRNLLLSDQDRGSAVFQLPAQVGGWEQLCMQERVRIVAQKADTADIMHCATRRNKKLLLAKFCIKPSQWLAYQPVTVPLLLHS